VLVDNLPSLQEISYFKVDLHLWLYMKDTMLVKASIGFHPFERALYGNHDGITGASVAKCAVLGGGVGVVLSSFSKIIVS